ncbi:glycosyltransferase [Herpetosiphon geysericola]|uniref:glycosyltransferase n=1 Tax=Herpetosiphon geysericola TaxID=70996 RepID=UPI0006C8E9F6|nr:nucleotide disphospho-sugar-binding domain-containing protein [Herpetosiphon geysericola]
MRILFTTHPVIGHFHPLVPLAQACVDAGHQVAFATGGDLQQAVEHAGFQWFQAGYPSLHAVPPVNPPVHEVDQRAWILANMYAGQLASAMLPDLLAIGYQWQPDLIVRNSFEYSGCIAAEACTIPHVSFEVSFFANANRDPSLLGLAVQKLCQQFNLECAEGYALLYRYAHLSCFAEPYQLPHVALPPTTLRFRPTLYRETRSTSERIILPSDRPTIYVTLGTIYGYNLHIFETILHAFQTEPYHLVMSIGQQHDPMVFGVQPAHITIVRYLPQWQILPHCDAVICHGGFSSLVGALSHGLPVIIIPLGADQPDHAQRCAELGVGIALDSQQLTPLVIQQTLRELIQNPCYRAKAQALQATMEAYPPISTAVPFLEQLVASNLGD